MQQDFSQNFIVSVACRSPGVYELGTSLPHCICYFDINHTDIWDKVSIAVPYWGSRNLFARGVWIFFPCLTVSHQDQRNVSRMLMLFLTRQESVIVLAGSKSRTQGVSYYWAAGGNLIKLIFSGLAMQCCEAWRAKKSPWWLGWILHIETYDLKSRESGEKTAMLWKYVPKVGTATYLW